MGRRTLISIGIEGPEDADKRPPKPSLDQKMDHALDMIEYNCNPEKAYFFLYRVLCLLRKRCPCHREVLRAKIIDQLYDHPLYHDKLDEKEIAIYEDKESQE